MNQRLLVGEFPKETCVETLQHTIQNTPISDE